MAQGRFSWFDVLITIVSFSTLLLDVVTDVAVTVQLYLDSQLVWGSLVLAFIVVPHVVINVFSLKWHSTDGSLTYSIVLPHVCLLAPFQRYIGVLWLGFRATREGHPRHTDAALREQNDASILRLFETFLEAAPQLLLQLTFMMMFPAHINWLQVLSAVSSLISLSWAMTAYCDSSRLNYQTPYGRRFAAMVMHLLWQLFMATARLSALVLFTSVLQAWVCLFAGLHWVLMTVWLWIKGTDFGQGGAERVLFRLVSGFIYVFVYLNLHEGPSRGRVAPYYCLGLLENGVLFAVWLVYGKPDHGWKIAAAVLVFGGFLLGGLCLMVYYRWLHPSGPHYMFTIKSKVPPPLLRGLHPPKSNSQQQDMETVGHHSPSMLRGSTLELSVESESPKKGDATLSLLMDSATRDALESVWQSGMHSSTSSSTSSLDAEDCSLNEFNATAKSESLTVKERSHSEHTSSQSCLSSTTVKAVSHTGLTLGASTNPNNSQRSLSGSLQPSDYSVTPDPSSPHPQGKAEPDMEDIEEGEEVSTEEQRLMSSEEGGPTGSAGRQKQQAQKSRKKFILVPDVVTPPGKPALQRRPSSTPISKQYHAGSKTRLRTELATDRFGGQNLSGTVYLDVDPSSLGAKTPGNCSSSASDILPSETSDNVVNHLPESFDLGESPIVAEESAKQSPTSVVMCGGEASFVRADREAMAPYPDIVESTSPEPQQPRMFLGSEDLFGERAGGGGESMWGASPNMSNNSSSQGREQGLSLPASVSHLPRLVDSFDSGSEPACHNANISQQLHPTELQKPEECPKDDSTSESPAGESPTANNDDIEISWSSMNVNENEWSGLNNLKALTPDESLCSFASNDQEEMPQDEDIETGQPKEAPVTDGVEEAFSRASTPSVPRSRSASSLYHEFSSAGVSPSPPPGLKASSRLSRNHSWVNSPFMSQAWQQPADTSWPLDYLSVDPAPPVGQDPYAGRLDPKEVVIQMLMDQLKRTSLRSSESNFSHLGTSHVRSPPMQDSRITALDQALRHLMMEDPNSTIMNSSTQDIRNRRLLRSDIDLMRQALDLIEMERFPHRFRQEMMGRESPEMYVSGQYRPPILDQGRETPQPQHLTGRRSSAEAYSDSRSHPRSSVRHEASVPSQVSGNRARSVRHDSPQAHVVSDEAELGLMGGQREGLYRYFVHSNSPIHTPSWTTPHNTPAVTPSQRHLLQRYLTQTHVEVGIKEDRVQAAETRSLRKPPAAKPGPRDQLSSTLPAAHPRQTSAHAPDVLTAHGGKSSSTLPHSYPSRSGRASGHQPFNINRQVGKTSRVHSLHVPNQSGRSTEPGTPSLMSGARRPGDGRSLAEKLEVVTDNPDSGMHSGSHSAASRRQPLQSLDNSPSLSPSSSITQQPVHPKPPALSQATSSSDKHRHSYAGGRSSSAQSSQVSAHPGSPMDPSRSRPQGHSHRQSADKSVDRSRRVTSTMPASQGSVNRRAKSVDNLR